jgi:hypothetical protein
MVRAVPGLQAVAESSAAKAGALKQLDVSGCPLVTAAGLSTLGSVPSLQALCALHMGAGALEPGWGTRARDGSDHDEPFGQDLAGDSSCGPAGAEFQGGSTNEGPMTEDRSRHQRRKSAPAVLTDEVLEAWSGLGSLISLALGVAQVGGWAPTCLLYGTPCTYPVASATLLVGPTADSSVLGGLVLFVQERGLALLCVVTAGLQIQAAHLAGLHALVGSAIFH